MIFTPEKEFFKLLFGVKITPPKNNSTNPTRGKKNLLKNYCVQIFIPFFIQVNLLGEPKYSVPVIIALSFLVIAIPLFIYRRTIWRCIRRQNDPNNERQALIPENIRNDYAANHIIEGDA